MADPFSIAAGAFSVAAFAATSCQCLFQIISRFSEGPNELRRHLSALRQLQATFSNIASLQHDDLPMRLLPPDFSSRLDTCAIDLQEMVSLTHSLYAEFEHGKFRRALTRMRWSVGDKQNILDGQLARVEAYHQTFSLDLSLLSM